MAYKPSQRPRPKIKIIFASLTEPTSLKQQTELHFFSGSPPGVWLLQAPAQGKGPNSEGRRGLGARGLEVEEEITGVEGKDFRNRWGPN